MSTQCAAVEVRDVAGRALKVHSELPHLVSLGGGRLSTAVTLHPLTEGRLTLGCGQHADIAVQGAGVEPRHCHVDNAGGVVTLVPLAEMTSVDGVRVMTPTRLTQGSMVCVGRSNYLRFNHPAEARVMRSAAIPNARINMVPLNFYTVSLPGVENVDGVDRKPPMAPRRSPRGSWGEVSNSSSCGSEEITPLSPKVFPMGVATVNSPASAVLGPHHKAANIHNGNGTNGHRSVTPQPASLAERRLGSLTSLPGINTSTSPEPRTLTTPSPAFNRNPAPIGRARNPLDEPIRRVSSPTPSPAFNRNPAPVSRRISDEPIRRVSSPTPSVGSNCSQEEMTARKEELEHKRKQAQTDRVREQEAEKRERARLEEILSMCADYERQVQLEKQCKSPGIPQNRIKTNGSLPRDKRLPSAASPSPAEEEPVEVFTFENTTRSPYENVVLGGFPQSPRTRIRTIAGKDTRDASEVIENRLALSNDYEYINSLPRNKSATPQPSMSQQTVNSSTSPAYTNVTFAHKTPVNTIPPYKATTANNNHSNNGVYQEVSSCTHPINGVQNETASYNRLVNGDKQNLPGDNHTVSGVNIELTNVNQLANGESSRNNHLVNGMHLELSGNTYPASGATQELSRTKQTANGVNVALTSSKSVERDEMILPLDMSPVDRLSEALEAMKAQNAQRSIDRRRSSEARRDAEKQGPREQAEGDEERQEQRTKLQSEYEALRKERTKLQAAMTGLKRNVSDIEQQEEEMLRELEMERALLDGEWCAQNDKLTQETQRQVELRGQLTQLDGEVAHFSARESRRQEECKTRLETAEENLKRSEVELANCGDSAEKQKSLTEQVKSLREVLEQEKKLFEDLEFRHLEEEANCLAGHDELQRELSDVTQRLVSRQQRLAELETQRLEADHSAQMESQGLERQLLSNLRKLEEVRNKLRTIEAKLSDLSSRGLFSSQDSSPDASSDNDDVVRPASIQSPDDIARISRVTQGAPLEISNGSLGRKTLESLQTIERNRQLHLAQQGSQVIENERKRVQELKRRVQDEVRAQWAEQHRREDNCCSLNSVGSDEASSDINTESASSDEMDKRRSAQMAEDKSNQDETDSAPRLEMRDKELIRARDTEERRPLTDGSDYEQQLAVNMRDKATRLQHQRPLTRYLPIRSELDLRLHIETAGHQIDLCPHVTLDATSCRGQLHKLGAKFHHWAKRWFVFDRSLRTFTYYSDRAEKKTRGGAYFQAIEEVYVDHLNSVKSPSPQLTFVVKTSERTYHLMAPSAEAMRIWVDVVFTGAEGYQEFEHGS